MPRTIEKAEKMTLPLIPLRGVVAFPGIPINFELSRDISIAAFEAARDDDNVALLLTQKDASVEDPAAADLYEVGVVVKIKQSLKNPDGKIRVIADGLCRARVISITRRNDKYIEADVMSKIITPESGRDVRIEALMREVIASAEQMLSFLPAGAGDMMLAAQTIKSPGLLADFIAANALVRIEDKQKVLDEFDPIARSQALIAIIEDEVGMLRVEAEIHSKVRSNIEQNQRDYYLREQLKQIQAELEGEPDDDAAEYIKKIKQAAPPEEVAKKLMKEASRLRRTPTGSPEAAVIRDYLDVCISIPWNKMTRDRTDVAAARKILDADHDGLDKVKQRILEFLAVKQLNPDLKNQILCLVGPPGTGKTSISASVARALKRKFVRVSLGGVRDEADIRGHRRTYIGSMPGRIINALIECGSRNPVMLLDEVDKMCADAHGDPAAALLELLDAEQNKAFVDHYTEVPVDLSEVMFITTANSLEPVARPLIDRMEVIELHTYTRMEKLAIAKNHLVPKQLKRHGLDRRKVKITDDALLTIIDSYTSESGVRGLERALATICRKSAMKLVESGVKRVTVDAVDVAEFLGPVRYDAEKVSETDEIGVVNGMAYTEVGGDLLKIEAAVMDGTGKLELTGTLGDVMRESARIAVSYIRAHAEELSVDASFASKKDIHIHVPEGAVPKDGPSAGVTMLTALVSALTGTPVRRDISMTGEITLTGRVLPIGGLREKATAAYTAGIREILIPKDNMRDLVELDKTIRDEVEFVPCRTVSDVLSRALSKKTLPAIDAAQIEISHPELPALECPPAASARGVAQPQ